MTTTLRSDEGLTLDAGEGEDALLFAMDGVEVRESTWAGAYYCAHVLFLSQRHGRASPTSILRDREGDPLVGFIHVPADAETTLATGASPSRTRLERHQLTARVVASALRGIADEAKAVGTSPARVLLTGFGPFAAVSSNPTGDFIEDDASVAAALMLAFGSASTDRIVLHRMRLDVDDCALDPSHPRSMPSAVAQFQPHAIVALGVHRASSIYRVEIDATNAGLRLVDGEAPRHERGLPASARPSRNRAIARCIQHGVRVLGL